MEAPFPRRPNRYATIAIKVVCSKVADVRYDLATIAVIAGEKEEGHKILRANVAGEKALNPLSQFLVGHSYLAS
ncbi:hypothetical protein CN933_03180 [Sinorhizobium sp. M4_45]|nr:hypothetical protein CN933_03180 [Sinorhizobium sp. M4_45]